MSLKTAALQSVFRFLQRRSNTPWVNRVQRLAAAVHRAAENPGYDIASNGERRAIDIVLAEAAEPTLLDIGAHVGHWSLTAASCLRGPGRIFALEPARASHAKLIEAVRAHPAIRCFSVGLSNRSGTMAIAHSDDNPQKTSVEIDAARTLNTKIGDYRSEPGDFLRGDEFCARHAIARVNFLKVDTEGHDLRVLEGFADMLGQGRIDVVQFEYNRLNLFSKALLHDFYLLLNSSPASPAFHIGRIFPSSIRFKRYEPADENFIDGNFLVVRTELGPLIERLRG
jgi:FkbM family methyltransferase